MSSRFIDFDSGRLVPGLVAVALFAVLAAVFLTAELGAPTGFPGEVSVVASIGYAMFNLQELSDIPSEGFLVAFIVIAIALDAALDSSIMLAKREEDGETVSALTDGGRRFGLGRDGAERADERSDDGGED
jgi:NADH-quinone oxidoreductase subunit J